MLRSLLLTSLISLGAGATAPAPLTNKTNYAINENTPINYSLNVESKSHVQNTTSNLKSYKYNYQNYNEALMVKGNIYIQNEIRSYSNSDDFNIHTANGNNTALYVFEITPYKYLYGNTTNINLSLNFDNIYNTDAKLKITASIYSSTDNWSSYLDLTNYYRSANNFIIISDITDTQNGYLYDKTTNIQNIDIDENLQNTTETTYINYNLNAELTMVNAKTNYYAIYIQTEYIPYNYENDADFDLSNFIQVKQNLMTLNGQMIPPVTNYEIVDLPGTMFYILTMPFTFISTAFNLTLFPGTIYQFNIGNLFLTIIGTLTFLFLIRLLTRNK